VTVSFISGVSRPKLPPESVPSLLRTLERDLRDGTLAAGF
jgi:hypothetical protein